MKTVSRIIFLCLSFCLFSMAHAQSGDSKNKTPKKLEGKWMLQSMSLEIDDKIVPAEMRDEAEGEKKGLESETEKYKDKAYFDLRKGGEMGMYRENEAEMVGKWYIEGNNLVLTKATDSDKQVFQYAVEKDVLRLSIENPEMKGMKMILTMKK
jgi:hypothetical protein